MFCTPMKKSHVNMRAMAVNNKQAPISAIASFRSAESVKYLGEQLVRKVVVGPAHW